MSNILVIPDVHLKYYMFDQAEEILDSGQADFAVQLGDLVDDWGEEYNISLYQQTIQRVIAFHQKFPKTLWCMGNHDFGYYYPEYGRREAGHSRFAEETMQGLIMQLKDAGIFQCAVHIVDNTVFSHAGLSGLWVKRQAMLWNISDLDIKGNLKGLINYAAPDELWSGNSPLWWRPQKSYADGNGDPNLESTESASPYESFTQVVGHTPVEKVTQSGNVLSTDVFSTYSNGTPIGEQKFIIVDTNTEDYEEPKKRWYITENGEIREFRIALINEKPRDYIEIGNYFETKEEAEKAVEKLKAWKRLKDKGIKLEGWYDSVGDDHPDNMLFRISEDAWETDTVEDLDLLFGGGRVSGLRSLGEGGE